MLEIHRRVWSPSLSQEGVEVPVPGEPNDAPVQVMGLGLLWELICSEHPLSLLLRGFAC